MAEWSQQQLQQMAKLLSGTHAQLDIEAALANAPTQRWAVDAQGRRTDPMRLGGNPATAAIENAAPGPARLPAPTMAFAPSVGSPPPQMPQQAIGQMQRNPLFGTPIGIIAQMLMGKASGPLQQRSNAPMPLTSAQRYAAANSGSGSVSAMERKHSGRPAGAYSDGREPSGTGSLW